jgi:hypothetical protein
MSLTPSYSSPLFPLMPLSAVHGIPISSCGTGSRKVNTFPVLYKNRYRQNAFYLMYAQGKIFQILFVIFRLSSTIKITNKIAIKVSSNRNIYFTYRMVQAPHFFPTVSIYEEQDNVYDNEILLSVKTAYYITPP